MTHKPNRQDSYKIERTGLKDDLHCIVIGLGDCMHQQDIVAFQKPDTSYWM